MIEMQNHQLHCLFPEVHPCARLGIELQRTLRIPDDGRDYPLPAGLGRFPLVHLDDHRDRVPAEWVERGGVLTPLYQSEALWVGFRPHETDDYTHAYPFAVKVAAGKINAVTGEPWSNGLRPGARARRRGDPTPDLVDLTMGRSPSEARQDFLSIPEQPWLDGYCVEKDVIRQFVAMPLGQGYSAEEQLTGKAEFGGLQIIAYPMKGEVYEREYRRPMRHYREMVMDSGFQFQREARMALR